MQLLQSIFLVLLLSYDVLSAPTAPQTQHKGRSFKVDRVRRSNTVHGPTALRRAYQKYGIVPMNIGFDLSDFEPISVKKISPSGSASSTSSAPEPEQTGAVSATSIQEDAEFVSPVTIGGQKIVMDFDTGSADFWVMNSNLPSDEKKGHTVFDPSKSSSFKTMEGATFKISYGDSSYASGEVGTDTVDIGGATVTKQAIGIPTTVSDSFIDEPSSNGLVGLGFSKLNTVQPDRQKTFFENLAENLDEPVLAASLKSNGVGEYEFGFIDHSKYQGDMVNITVDSSNGYWEFESARFSVGNGDLQNIEKTPTAIADTGTSLMLVSPEVVDAYYKQVEGSVYADSASGWIYPCGADLPDLSVAIGDAHLATIPGALIDYSEVGINTTTGKAVCYGGVQTNQGTSMQIFGDVFLKALYVVFDMRGPSLGFAAPA
ncbi:hypothetical protein ASPWEDRAFT_106749 [Aspergillus wentii DTO 134E9]|uniref:Peptidase A1 domain-containing protein n=1 Tax=Aspergillus wentii DTO 134E9 TaxID=1073089 RepID=A0A1L9RRF3_ASPWE|nr:uncharacterized protein ASPWEDRAFT_106749 [Aspergillus wentii DTO 134E9]KAI9930361.1 hypothetical protein MW887_011114 [Aspergillus wentii]OJJ37515.1 hypothetical protein ASPWEDRAFT_106749 [Aspergillus wentii DTO 134E9]